VPSFVSLGEKKDAYLIHTNLYNMCSMSSIVVWVVAVPTFQDPQKPAIAFDGKQAACSAVAISHAVHICQQNFAFSSKCWDEVGPDHPFLSVCIQFPLCPCLVPLRLCWVLRVVVNSFANWFLTRPAKFFVRPRNFVSGPPY
jgi:hypothetical protein